MVKNVRRTEIDRARLQGIAVALAEVAGSQMEPDVAIFALKNLGFTVADLKKAGADSYDLDILKAAEA